MMPMKLQTITLGRRRLARSSPISCRPSNVPNHCHQSRFLAFHRPPATTREPFLSRLWQRYTDALLTFPLLVKGGSASFIFFLSDSATQKIMDPESEWDGSRALSGAGFGVVATCWLHYWWGFLEVVINKRLPVGAYRENKFANALAKVAADQLLGAPLYLYLYYCVTHFGKEWSSLSSATTKSEKRLQDETFAIDPSVSSLLRETSDRALNLLPDTIMRHWTVWPMIHTWNFYYNPIHHRVLVQNIMLIFWSGYLSHLNNGGLDLMTPEQELELTSQTRQRLMLENEDKYIATILSS